MHAFVTNLTAAALLTHALVGCYGHHALECMTCVEVAAIEVAAASPCCHHDHDAPAEKQSPADPCPCELSCHGTCVTLLPQKTLLDAPDANSCDVLVADQAAVGQLCGLFSCWERGQIPTAHQPPLRLHLLHQSLLI